jgi:hypothetical protein
MNGGEMEAKKPRKKFKPSGQMSFKPLHEKSFSAVLDYATEVNEAINSGSPMFTPHDHHCGPVDYLICVDQAIKAAELNKGMIKNWRKLLDGKEISAGSKNMLVAKLAPLFISAEYSLWPRARFFCPAQAWTETQRKRKTVLYEAMSPKQVVTAAPNYFIPSDTARHCGEDGAPRVVAEAPIAQEPAQGKIPEEFNDFDPQSDASFARQESSA